jgi:hypothetical protein
MNHSVTLQDLIHEGLLQPPLVLTRLHKGVRLEATIGTDGCDAVFCASDRALARSAA